MTIKQQQPKKRALDYIKENPTPKRVASYHWAMMNSRVKDAKRYKGIKLRLDRGSFQDFVEAHWSDYKVLYRDWNKAGFIKALSPSIDRIDNDGHYEKGNIRFLTFGDNARRAYRGNNNRLSKLDEDAVREIRKLSAQGITQTEIAKRFGVKQNTISYVLSGELWGYVK